MTPAAKLLKQLRHERGLSLLAPDIQPLSKVGIV